MEQAARSYPWAIWAEWAGDPELTLAEGADRLVATFRSVERNLLPDNRSWHVSGGKADLANDDPEFVAKLTRRLARSRTPAMVAAADRFADASLSVSPRSPGGPWGSLLQGVSKPGDLHFHDGWFRLEFSGGGALRLGVLTEQALRVLADIARAWQARNAWIDMVHVRQQWNQWDNGLPVFGWATWLHPSFATVDTDGLDVETSIVDGCPLVVLRTDPDATADRAQAAGRDVIWRLAERTTLADGTALLDRNPRLGAVIARGAPRPPLRAPRTTLTDRLASTTAAPLVDRIVALGLVDARDASRVANLRGRTLRSLGESEDTAVLALLVHLGIVYLLEEESFQGVHDEAADGYRAELDDIAEASRGMVRLTDVELVDADARHLLRFSCNGRPVQWSVAHADDEHTEDRAAYEAFRRGVASLVPTDASQRWCVVEPELLGAIPYVFADPDVLAELLEPYGLEIAE
ncbi:MAG TPA: hypothetical protein VH561_10145 [Micromonosporaceae bacterium]|jgi:hypothetical protein